MNETVKTVVIVIFIALSIGVLIRFFNGPSTQIASESSVWCYLKTIKPGEAIQEHNAGTYEYQIFATQKGIEVWKPCK